MNDTGSPPMAERVLVLAPTEKDAHLCREILEQAGVSCTVCTDLAQLCRELEAGAGTALVTEESLDENRFAALAQVLKRQPPWSDLPILVLTSEGAGSEIVAQTLETLGNVTLLERPVRVATLISAVRTALRARRRQYQIRSHMEQQQATAHALRQSEERHRQLADNLPAGFIYQIAQSPAGDLRFSYASKGIELLLGLTPEEATANPAAVYGLILPDHLPRVKACEEAAHREGKPFECQFPCRRRGGGLRWLHCRSAPRPLPDGSALWDGIAMDITDRKRAEEERDRLFSVAEQKAAQLREADRLKDEFLAMLAHELRNPLAPIRNALHILKQPGTAEDLLVRVQEMAERQVQHMARLLDDLLDVSRISRGMIELHCERVDLKPLIHRTVETVRPLLEERRLQLTIDLAAEPLLVHGDDTRLEQIITNLLNNAAKYTDPAGRIWLSAMPEEGDIVLRVRDTGIGIAAEMLPKIFDLFVQAERRVDRAKGGVGIGLTLVRRLVELHGGAIEAFSAGLSQGSEFRVRLPALPKSLSSDRPAFNGRDRKQAAFTRRSVLVVDDNPDAADSLALLLELMGQDVRTAYDGPAALGLARDRLHSLIFLDIGMPGMDGYEVARLLRQERRLQEVVLVALTGWGQEEDRRRSREAGFNHHLVKPVEPAAIEKLLLDMDGRVGAAPRS